MRTRGFRNRSRQSKSSLPPASDVVEPGVTFSIAQYGPPSNLRETCQILRIPVAEVMKAETRRVVHPVHIEEYEPDLLPDERLLFERALALGVECRFGPTVLSLLALIPQDPSLPKLGFSPELAFFGSPVTGLPPGTHRFPISLPKKALPSADELLRASILWRHPLTCGIAARLTKTQKQTAIRKMHRSGRARGRPNIGSPALSIYFLVERLKASTEEWGEQTPHQAACTRAAVYLRKKGLPYIPARSKVRWTTGTIEREYRNGRLFVRDIHVVGLNAWIEEMRRVVLAHYSLDPDSKS